MGVFIVKSLWWIIPVTVWIVIGYTIEKSEK